MGKPSHGRYCFTKSPHYGRQKAISRKGASHITSLSLSFLICKTLEIYQAQPTLILRVSCLIIHVQLFGTLWTIAHQTPLSMGFSRQEYWNGLQCPPPGYLSNPGIKPTSLMSPALAGVSFITSSTWEVPEPPLPPSFLSLLPFGSGMKKNGGKRCCLFLISWLLCSCHYRDFFLSFISSINTSLTASVDVLNAKSL